MSTNKRLFLFAAYDKNGTVDDALIFYVSNLAKFGDVVVFMDNDAPKSEINKLKQYTIYAAAQRHGEYDFGSYKRAYQYARNKNILKNYDSVYLLNDSVFGPMFDMTDLFQKMDTKKTDAVSMVISKHKTHSFMESWFVQLNKKIFLSDWFDKFMSSVKQESDKYIITVKYEHGLTNLIKNNNCSWSGLYECYGRFTYNKPKSLFKLGCPFVKKASFTRHFGDCGKQINYIFNHSDKNAIDSIRKTANRVYGEKYMNKFLTNNSVKIYARKILYLTHKIKNGEI
jgi:hypothetical protein